MWPDTATAYAMDSPKKPAPAPTGEFGAIIPSMDRRLLAASSRSKAYGPLSTKNTGKAAGPSTIIFSSAGQLSVPQMGTKTWSISLRATGCRSSATSSCGIRSARRPTWGQGGWHPDRRSSCAETADPSRFATHRAVTPRCHGGSAVNVFEVTTETANWDRKRVLLAR